MNIKTRFKLGDTVYFIDYGMTTKQGHSQICVFTVDRIDVSIKYGRNNSGACYAITNDQHYFPDAKGDDYHCDHNCFKTKAEAQKMLDKWKKSHTELYASCPCCGTEVEKERIKS